MSCNGNKSRSLAMTSESTHGTKELPSEDLFALTIPVPPLAEQRTIATALADVDAPTDGLEQLIAKNRDVKQATMRRRLTGEQRLPGADAGWQPRTFGELFEFGRTASDARSDLGTGGEVGYLHYGYLHYGDIHKTSATFWDCDSASLPTITRATVAGVPIARGGDLVMIDASEDHA